MKPKLILCLAFVLSGILFAYSSVSAQPATNNDLTKQISAILTEYQKIKPGMTRAELLKIFTTQGGIWSAMHRTFVYRGCPYIKVDVDFTLSDPKQKGTEERPTTLSTKFQSHI